MIFSGAHEVVEFCKRAAEHATYSVENPCEPNVQRSKGRDRIFFTPAGGGAFVPGFRRLTRRDADYVQADSGRAGRLGCLSVIDKTFRLPSSPRSRIALSIRSARSGGVSRARQACLGTPIEPQPQEGPLIAGWEVLFAFPRICAADRSFSSPGGQLNLPNIY